MHLLPTVSSSTSSGVVKPRWRDFGDVPEDALTIGGQARYVAALVDRALDRVGHDPYRWRSLLDSLRAITQDQCHRALAQMDTVARGDLPAEIRSALWELVRGFTARHRTYHDSDWAFPGEVLSLLEAILPFLAPENTVELARWLFDEWLPELPSGEDDQSIRERQVEEWRTRAVTEILHAEGTQGIIRLGVSCRFPGFVARTVIAQTDFAVAQVLVNEAVAVENDAGVFLAGQLSSQAEARYGGRWRQLIFAEASSGRHPPSVVASLMSLWPDERPTWDQVTTLNKDIENEYWRRKPICRILGNAADQVYQIDRLIDAGRAADAFDRLAFDCKGIPTEALLRLFDATIRQLADARTPDEVRRTQNRLA